jgi:serine/threonine protein kinase
MFLHAAAGILKFAVHQQGYMHRDIKPQNLLLERESGPLHIKLVDFDTAVRTTGANLFPAGSKAYWSPERFVGTGRADSTKADIWSLGYICTSSAVSRRPSRAPKY